MRFDMAKVIVERPRYGSRRRGQGKGWRRDLQRVPADELPRREGIKQTLGGNTKRLNEHLGPLRRYLRNQVGRPWNKVFAEICANISRTSAVQDHVRDHVMDYVATNVAEIDGVLNYTTRWGQLVPLYGAWFRPLFYVCPKCGLLKIVKRAARRKRRYKSQPQPVAHVPIDYQTSFIHKNGTWNWVRFHGYPKSVGRDINGLPRPIHDPFQDLFLSRADAVRLYGRAVLAKESRPATREEIRKVCEPLKAPNRV